MRLEFWQQMMFWCEAAGLLMGIIIFLSLHRPVRWSVTFIAQLVLSGFGWIVPALAILSFTGLTLAFGGADQEATQIFLGVIGVFSGTAAGFLVAMGAWNFAAKRQNQRLMAGWYDKQNCPPESAGSK